MLYITVAQEELKDLRKCLYTMGLLPKGARAFHLLDGSLAMPVLEPSHLNEDLDQKNITINEKIYQIKVSNDLPSLRPRKPYEIMMIKLEDFMKDLGLWSDSLRCEIPDYWDKCGDLVIFGPHTFLHSAWTKAGEGVWKVICQCLKVRRIARLHKVMPDKFRTPKLEFIFGSEDWVQRVDNRIRYTWDAKFCMFSKGNATERTRVSKMDCSDETVIDMFAGIGYFTLQFLVLAKAKFVHACEWNPSAVAALKENLAINKVADRCQIHKGDCLEVTPTHVADRVYMGLIPSCEHALMVACKGLKPDTGGVLHIHANVSSYKKKGREVGSISDNDSIFRSYLRMNGDSDNVDAAPYMKTEPQSEPSCSECQNFEKVFPPDLLSYIEHPLLTSGGEISHSCSFVLQGSRGLPTWFPEAEVAWKKKEWLLHAYHLAHLVFSHLLELHKRPWGVAVTNINHVKSYAPHVDHLVYDLKCVPDT